MRCERVTFTEFAAKYEQDCEDENDTLLPMTKELAEQVDKDIEGIVKYHKRAGKRKCCPPWAVPPELMLQLARPNYRAQQRSQAAW